MIDIKKHYYNMGNEDINMMLKLVRCGFGNNNVDNCARV